MSDHRKPGLSLPADVVEEMRREAQRLERSLSWVAQRAWLHARKQIRDMPGAEDEPARRPARRSRR